jgi:hypothetical protein
MPARRLVVTLASAAVALAACGGGSTSGGATTTVAAAGTTAAAAAGASTTAPNFSGAGSGDLCSYAKQVVNSNLANSLTSGSSNMKDTFSKLDDVFKQIQSKAPAEIKADVNTLASGLQKIEAVYAKYGYDITKLEAAAKSDPQSFQSLTSTLDDPSYQAASDRVDAYFSKVCGISSDTGSSTTTG